MMDWLCEMRKGYVFCNVKLNWGGGVLLIGLENYAGDLTREGEEVECWVFYTIVTSSLQLKDNFRVGVRCLEI